MTSTSAGVIQSLKLLQSLVPPSRKLSHQEVRKLLKKERRRSKRRQEAEKKDEACGDQDQDSGSGAESDQEEYLRSKNLWLMREHRISRTLEREARRRSAEQTAKAIAVRRGLDEG